MSQLIKFQEQELAEIRSLATKFQEKIFQFGQFRVERMNLLAAVKDVEERETKAEEEYRLLEKMQEELLEKLTKKYGDGQLDMKDGTFRPAVPVTIEQKTATP